jgi:hypothetical protein
MWGRSGWYAVGAKGESRIVFLYSHHGQTHVMDMSVCRTDDGCIVVDHSFSLSSMLRALSDIEEPNPEDDLPVHELIMTAISTEKGVLLRPGKARLIDKSAPRKEQPQAPTDGEEPEDSLDGLMPSDSIESSNGSVDTDVEDDDDLEDEEGHAEEEPATIGAEAACAATGAEAPDLGEGIEPSSGDEKPRHGRHASGTHVVWTNGYFFLQDRRDQKHLRILMYGHWGRDDQMGKYNLSKQLVPSEFDEDRNDPRRTKVVLRAWALWRMRQSGAWFDAHSRRHRQLARDEAELERDIKALPGPITGNALADVMLKRLAPDVVGRLGAR